MKKFKYFILILFSISCFSKLTTSAEINIYKKIDLFGEVLENIYNASKYNDRQKLDIVAQELAIAHKKLDEITGGDYNDEVLESIFSEFCIGK